MVPRGSGGFNYTDGTRSLLNVVVGLLGRCPGGPPESEGEGRGSPDVGNETSRDPAGTGVSRDPLLSRSLVLTSPN